MKLTELAPATASDALRRIVLPGGTFAYFERGTAGAPLAILQHGFPDHPRSFIALMNRLSSAGFHCVAPFLRGYLPSTTGGPFHRDRLGADLVELAQELSPDPAVLIGHDWGAVATYSAVRLSPETFRFAVALAVPHVAAFERNVLTSPAQQKRSAYMAFFMIPRAPERVLARDDFALVDTLWRRWSPHLRPDPDHLREVKAVLRASLPGPLGPYRALRPSPTSFRQSQRDARARVTVPLLHLHGADDGCIAFEAGAGQERHFANTFRSERLPGLGHFLHLEDPDRVCRAILNFGG